MNTITTLALLTAALTTTISTPAPPLTEYVHAVEVNHVEGRFTQLIYRDHLYQIRDWRTYDPNNSCMMPKQGPDGILRATWNDGGVWRSIEVKTMYETWTEHDPEVVDRKWRPMEGRRKLGEVEE